MKDQPSLRAKAFARNAVAVLAMGALARCAPAAETVRQFIASPAPAAAALEPAPQAPAEPAPAQAAGRAAAGRVSGIAANRSFLLAVPFPNPFLYGVHLFTA